MSKREVVNKCVSLSRTVSGWAEELVQRRGFETNFSAYIADLIRRDWERQGLLPEAKNAGQRQPKNEFLRSVNGEGAQNQPNKISKQN